MNKQELIDKLKKLLEMPSEVDGYDFYYGHDFGIRLAVVLVKQLDEPVRPPEPNPLEIEKPVVPQFVADFYESIKDDFENKVYELCLQYKHRGDELPQGVAWWFGDSRNKPIETLVMMHKFGYEVEKEKLYAVEIPNPNSAGGKTVLSKQQSTGKLILEMLNSDINKPKYLHLTEAEIKEDFAWAWQFAKEVEE